MYTHHNTPITHTHPQAPLLDTHTRDLMLRSTTNRHSSSTSNTHRQATHRPITHVHNNTCVHSSQHTNYSYLLRSFTVVMVELEPTAALKCFRPTSVMLSSTVHYVSVINSSSPPLDTNPRDLMLRPTANMHSSSTSKTRIHPSNPHIHTSIKHTHIPIHARDHANTPITHTYSKASLW